MSGLYMLLGTLVTLGVLVTIHEYGHFWVARRCGVKVLRFSIGFGTPLLRWHDRQGTEFVIALIPLGGYVKMLDERVESVPEARRHQAFNTQSVWRRFAIVAGGFGRGAVIQLQREMNENRAVALYGFRHANCSLVLGHLLPGGATLTGPTGGHKFCRPGKRSATRH